MISDNPDEDADNLDDEALLKAYLCPKPDDIDAAAETDLPDWPPLRTREVGLPIDLATLDWFRTHHADWRREMRFVLRAWVAAQTGAVGTTPLEDRGTPQPPECPIPAA